MYEEQDEQKRIRVKAINKLESLCNDVKNFLSDQTLVFHVKMGEVQLMEKLKSDSLLLIAGQKSGVTTPAEFEAQSEEIKSKMDPIFSRAKLDRERAL